MTEFKESCKFYKDNIYSESSYYFGQGDLKRKISCQLSKMDKKIKGCPIGCSYYVQQEVGK